MRFCNRIRLAVGRRYSAIVGGMEFANPICSEAARRELRQTEGGAMGFLVEVDLDEFLELMECETEARLRVAEIMERRRRAKKLASDLEVIDSNKAH